MSSKQFHLPLHQQPQYWITLYPLNAMFAPPVMDMLARAGARPCAEEGMSIRTEQNWKAIWDVIYAGLKAHDALPMVEVGLSSGDAPPFSRADSGCKAPVVLQTIAESMWLGDALLENRIICYLQPIHSSKDRVFGYESFARVKAADGNIIGGDKIIAASKVLGMEYMIDRHLHVEAIKTYASSGFNGFLFVNFFPGFIHRPAVYLEGLSETAKQFGIVSKHIVLEFTNAEKPRDLTHVRGVCEYARSKGYSVALDDLTTLEGAAKLVEEVRPDFAKIDMHLTRQVDTLLGRDTVRDIVSLVHRHGGAVVAEGVETQEVFSAVRDLGVDLFQGYFFAPPAPVEVVLARNSAAS